MRSGAHAKPKTRGTLRALGLGRIGKTNTLPDRPEIRGMIARVPHLVRGDGRRSRPGAGTPQAPARRRKHERVMTIKPQDLAPAPGATKSRKRVGRGIGGKGGKTAGRGTKGQHARNTVARGFEGGQMPLKQRVPKLKGFNNPFRVEYSAINLDTLGELAERFAGGRVDPETLVAAGVVRRKATTSRCSPVASATTAWASRSTSTPTPCPRRPRRRSPPQAVR